jgi:hypothetical protein
MITDDTDKRFDCTDPHPSSPKLARLGAVIRETHASSALSAIINQDDFIRLFCRDNSCFCCGALKHRPDTPVNFVHHEPVKPLGAIFN